MNKKITAAFAAAKDTQADDEKVDALKELAVPKFKEIYRRVQEAIKTVNRHVAPGKGTPNRAKMAMAIGLFDELDAYANVAEVIGMKEMADAVAVLRVTINEIRKMREERKYDHITYLPDFMTVPEKNAADVLDCRFYLANITDAVNAAIDTIGRHVVLGDFDVNTFKVAKAIGYGEETGRLRADFTALAERTGDDFTAELGQLDAIDKAIAAIADDKAKGFTAVISAINVYCPYAENEDDGDVEYPSVNEDNGIG